MTSALQKEAERQVLSMHNELALYRQFMTSGFTKPGYMPNQPAWHISHETLDGDFALDEVLAQKLASNVVASNTEADWLKDYLDGKLFDSSANSKENLGDVTVGRGNLSGNLNSVRQSAEAVIAQNKINSAAAKITAGKAQSVKITNHMTLYNANKSGKGRPRLRVKVTRLPLEVISSTLSPNGNNPRPLRGGFSARGKDVIDMSKLGGLTSKARIFNGNLGGGILTFAPTMAFDLYDSVGRDAHGSLHVNVRQFTNAELRNQPGNAAGFVAGMVGGAVAVACGAVGAPVILVGLGFGIAAQFLWNALDAPAHMPQI